MRPQTAPEKGLLLREMHHRVKNNLQVITSLLSLQAHKAPDPKTRVLLHESQNRVRAMAMVHETLYRSDDLCAVDCAEYLRALAGPLYQSYGLEPGAVQLRFQVPPGARISVETATPFGLIVNELISNALKHAFPGGRRGEIVVRLERLGADQYRLLVSDDGVGVPTHLDLRHTGTLGLRLVRALAEQLDGSVRLARGEGSRFEVTLRDQAAVG
ncbi:MAG: sensor histidine kinase [Acidobacteria bacterium]|nr:sensor histidine kinase [Acidobacteriota bacterium]